MLSRFRVSILLFLVAISCYSAFLWGAETVDHPFLGITSIARTEATPRSLSMHIVLIDLTAHGIRFELTRHSGSLETVRQTTLDFLNQEHAQVAVNAHFFTPFPSSSAEADVIGLAASDGMVYSGFESPEQSYALVAFAPAINIDHSNHASIVHYDRRFVDARHIKEHVQLWNAVAGSAQIITNGVKTIPGYSDQQHPDGVLKEGGPSHFSNRDSWYDRLQARTVIGLTQDEKTLLLFTVDRAAGSLGMKLGEIADLLIKDYSVYNALNLDGGGSTTLAIENPVTHLGILFNTSSDNAKGRPVGSNLAVFAEEASAPR
jgi:exopolysaccharide biosynthesis protein